MQRTKKNQVKFDSFCWNDLDQFSNQSEEKNTFFVEKNAVFPKKNHHQSRKQTNSAWNKTVSELSDFDFDENHDMPETMFKSKMKMLKEFLKDKKSLLEFFDQEKRIAIMKHFLSNMSMEQAKTLFQTIYETLKQNKKILERKAIEGKDREFYRDLFINEPFHLFSESANLETMNVWIKYKFENNKATEIRQFETKKEFMHSFTSESFY